MGQSVEYTRNRILQAVSQHLAEDALANLSLDRICQQAGVTKKTLYNHFRSKDDLLAAAVEIQRPRNLDLYRMWAESCGPGASANQILVRIFENIAGMARNPSWKGCCFIRVRAELGSLAGHPAHQVVARAAMDMEDWITGELIKDGHAESRMKARQLCVLINGLLLLQLGSRGGQIGDDVISLVNAIVPERKSGEPRHLQTERIDKSHFLQAVKPA